MAERPILFSGAMVRSLLAGAKTQTRRVVKPQPEFGLQRCHYSSTGWALNRDEEGHACTCKPVRAPFGWGDATDSLWVRETLKRAPDVWTYAADGAAVAWPARRDLAGLKRDTVVSIHMPRWASRLTLQITDVRVERLQDISERDARAEGLQARGLPDWPEYRGADALPWRFEFPRDAFADLWNHINGAGSWDANPWVWAVSFERVTP